VNFLFVYVREAHPSDGWQMPVNVEQDVEFAQPRSLEERRSIAAQCCTRLKLTMPCVVDTIDNKVDEAYAAWPERLFVIAADGRVAYAGGQGPFAFNPDELSSWLGRK
jgi:hypothetical protein